MKNIIICHIGTPDGPLSNSLKHYGIERILQRTIIELSFSIGSYGMGDPGFWGFKLNKTKTYPEEWLILSLWGAGCAQVVLRWLYSRSDRRSRPENISN